MPGQPGVLPLPERGLLAARLPAALHRARRGIITLFDPFYVDEDDGHFKMRPYAGCGILVSSEGDKWHVASSSVSATWPSRESLPSPRIPLSPRIVLPAYVL